MGREGIAEFGVWTPFLDRLTPVERGALLAHAAIQRHEGGRTIFDETDSDRDLYLVMEGSVTARSFSADGKEVIYAEIACGDCFGEFSALDGGPRSTTVIAVGAAVTGRIGAARLEALLRQHPGIALAMARHLTAKIRLMTARVRNYSTLSVRSRVRLELYRMARAAMSEGATAVVNPAPTHHELAARLSTHREAVSREISILESRAILRAGRRSLSFLDLRALEALIGDERAAV